MLAECLMFHFLNDCFFLNFGLNCLQFGSQLFWKGICLLGEFSLTFVIVFSFLLIFSAFFSGSETAFFSINSIILEKFIDEKSKQALRVVKLLSTPRRLLITILIGNTLVNVTAASIAVILTTRLCDQVGISKEIGIILNVLIVTFLILVISEISPKIFAVKSAATFSKNVSFLISIFYYLFLPFSAIIDKTITLLTNLFNMTEADREKFLKTNEFQALLELGAEQGELELEEKEMIHSIFEFGDTIVREIMVPRTDMVCVPHDAGVDDLIKTIKEKGHTRIPVYKDSIDDIKGLINAKDLLPFIFNTKKPVNLLDLARPAIFVPESKNIDDLLRLFQKQRQHMAIVVDEYGGTSGIVTLEDVIEEIVGEIRDEYDKEQALYRKMDENSYIVNAKIDIESLNDLIDMNIPISEDYDTLGGFIFDLIGEVPEKEQVIAYKDYEITIKEVKNNRIIQVAITTKQNKEELKANNVI
jgi:putative hemolysin